MTTSEMMAIASGFSEIARRHGISLFTCSEEIDLSAHGIAHAACIDKHLIERIIGSRLHGKFD